MVLFWRGFAFYRGFLSNVRVPCFLGKDESTRGSLTVGWLSYDFCVDIIIMYFVVCPFFLHVRMIPIRWMLARAPNAGSAGMEGSLIEDANKITQRIEVICQKKKECHSSLLSEKDVEDIFYDWLRHQFVTFSTYQRFSPQKPHGYQPSVPILPATSHALRCLQKFKYTKRFPAHLFTGICK